MNAAAGSRTERRRERERAQRRAEILAAAERVFARGGYQAATMAQIAQAAEFAVGTLYNFFPSKEALLEQLLLDQLAALEGAIHDAIAGSRDAATALERLALANARWKAERRSFLSIFVSPLEGQFQAVGPSLPSVEAVVARLRALTLDVVRRGVAAGQLTRDLPPEVIALLYGAAVRAYVVERVLRSGGEVDDQEVRAVVRALLQGLGRRGR